MLASASSCPFLFFPPNRAGTMSLMVASQREHCFLSSETAVHSNSDSACPNVDPLPWSKRWQRSDSCDMFGRRGEESSSHKSFEEDDGLELSLSLGSRCPKAIANRTSEEGNADQTVKKAQNSMQQQGMCRNEQQKPQNNEVPIDLQHHNVSASPLSAVEIWHSIQRTSSQEEIEATSYEAAACLMPQLVRRSASLQFVQPQRTGGDAVNLQRGTSFQFVDRQPSLVRGLSCTKSMEEKDCRLEHDRQQHEAQELQRKRELQAQRRQEARKRRKSLIEEKQLKRAKRDEGKYATPLLRTSSNSAAMQNNHRSPNGNGGGLPLDIIPANRASLRSEELEQENCVKSERNAAGKTAAEDTQILLDPSSKKVQPSQLWRLTQDLESSQKAEAKPVDVGETNGTSTGEAEMGSVCQVVSTCTEDCQSKTKEEDLQEAKVGSEKREEDHEDFIHKLERDESIQGPSSQVPGAVANTAFPYTSPSFPLFPIPYPLSVPVSTPPGLPLQMGFSVPYFMHLLPPNSQGFTDSRDPACSQPLPPVKFPICTAVTSYGMPIPEACLPWLSGALSQVASQHVPQASWGKSSHSMDEQDQASSNETHVKDEMKSLSSNSVQGTSLTSGKHEDGCFLAELEKPSGYLPDGSLKRAAAEHVYSQRMCESEAQFGLIRTVSDSAAQLLLHRESRRDPYARDSTECPKKPLALRRSFSATRAQTQDAMVVPSPDRDQNCPTFPSGSPSQCNIGGLKSEAERISGHNSRKVASGDNLGKNACNLPRCSPIKSKSGERPAVSDLPWVSSTGPAPDGRTVTGVMYIFDKKHVKIVCSCHSTHMSPSEFVQHAGFTDLSNPERNILVNSSSCVR